MSRRPRGLRAGGGLLTLALGLGFLGGATPAAAQPTWWLTLGGQSTLERGSLAHTLDPEAAGVLAGGWHLRRLGAVLLGTEAEGTLGWARATIGIVGDTVTVARGRLGVRGTWWEEHDEPTLVPYLRGGAVYRIDRSSLVRDDGLGWYAGVGVDLRLDERWAIGPFATYEEVSLSVTTRTWVFGFGVTLAY